MDTSGQDVGREWLFNGNPSHSRAFDPWMTKSESDPKLLDNGNRFFVPSYLEGSTYVHKLQEAHRSMLQTLKEVKTTSEDASPASASLFEQASIPMGSHRGMSHTVVERPPPFEDDDSLPPLPTKWNKDDMWTGIELLTDELGCKYVGSGSKNHHDREHEAFAIRADHHMPLQCGIYYYEVSIISGKRDDVTIGIGFSSKTAPLSRPVGWEPESWGYHGDDGRSFNGHNNGRPYTQPFQPGDVIGCGVNFRNRTAFFTRNGKMLDVAFQDVSLKNKLYPTVSLKKAGEQIHANFGQSPFVFNIDDVVREQRESIRRQIDNTSVRRLEPGMSEADLTQTLVLQFLQHEGYIETARAFAKDMQTQKAALDVDPKAEVPAINLKDDADSHNRQRIRKAIMGGEIDQAVKYIQAFYPRVFREDRGQVYFKLRCRKFIELVRKAAQHNMANESNHSKGHGSDGVSEEMELDDGAEVQALEQKMLEYGQALQEEYQNDERQEVVQALGDIYALLAYPNPLKEPAVSHMLDRKGRAAVAEEVNSAILSSAGRPSRAALEKLYAQTNMLLEELRQDGGDGAFASIQDAIHGIPNPSQP